MNQPTSVVTILVMAATVLVSYRAFASPALFNRLLFSPAPILRGGQYPRLLTSGFVHGGWAHLLFNMFSFYSFGRYLELVYGPRTLLIIYFVSLLGGNLISLFLHRHHDHYRAVGASGGVCGVIFASIFLLPGGGVRMFLLPFALPTWAFAIIFILGSFYGLRAGSDNIGHDAHLGGALVGVGVTTLLYPGIILGSPLLYVAVVGLAGAALVYTVKNPPTRRF